MKQIWFCEECDKLRAGKIKSTNECPKCGKIMESVNPALAAITPMEVVEVEE